MDLNERINRVGLLCAKLDQFGYGCCLALDSLRDAGGRDGEPFPASALQLDTDLLDLALGDSHESLLKLCSLETDAVVRDAMGTTPGKWVTTVVMRVRQLEFALGYVRSINRDNGAGALGWPAELDEGLRRAQWWLQRQEFRLEAYIRVLLNSTTDRPPHAGPALPLIVFDRRTQTVQYLDGRYDLRSPLWLYQVFEAIYRLTFEKKRPAVSGPEIQQVLNSTVDGRDTAINVGRVLCKLPDDLRPLIHSISGAGYKFVLPSRDRPYPL